MPSDRSPTVIALNERTFYSQRCFTKELRAGHVTAYKLCNQSDQFGRSEEEAVGRLFDRSDESRRIDGNAA